MSCEVVEGVGRGYMLWAVGKKKKERKISIISKRSSFETIDVTAKYVTSVSCPSVRVDSKSAYHGVSEPHLPFLTVVKFHSVKKSSLTLRIVNRVKT